MYKRIIILILILMFLVSCKQDTNEAPGGGSLENKSNYKAIYLDENIYLVTESPGEFKKDDLANISLANANIRPKMGELINFNKIDGVKESYPAQTMAYDVDVKKGPVKGVNISINDVQKFVNVLSDSSMLVDVRTKEEYEEGHLEGAILIPLDEIENRLEELDKEKIIFVYCRSGNRSGQAQGILEENGFFAINAGGVIDFKGKLVK